MFLCFITALTTSTVGVRECRLGSTSASLASSSCKSTAYSFVTKMAIPLIDDSLEGTPAQTDTTAPRKRRKRAPAAGAAEDCFTCTTRNLKCDRRRPYCSKCLDDGKDCAGYRTQLTWGNGVASRGKLRGLSLPIAGTQKVATPMLQTKPKRRTSQQQQQPVQTWPQGRHGSFAEPLPVSAPAPSPFAHGVTPASNNNIGFQFDKAHRSLPVPRSYPASSWDSSVVAPSPATTGTNTEPANSSYSNAPSIPVTSSLDGYEFGPGFRPHVAYGESDRLSPGSFSAPSPESAYFGRVLSHGSKGGLDSLTEYPVSSQFASPYDNTFPDQGQYALYQTREEPYGRGNPYAQPLTSLGELVLEQRNMPPVDEHVEEVGRDLDDNECAIVEVEHAPGLRLMSLNYSLPLLPFAGMGAIGATPRMQYLINYYTEVISPVIVAFDGPSNPYRTHILRLAARSETLQHAISALSASNLRQRRETGALSTGKTDPARRSSRAHLTLTNESWHNVATLSPHEQAREESLHKGIAIQSLNKQLADPLQRKDDSILATLLILCLFHICDSGIAKFQTQFAGVKKLLGFREKDLGVNTKEAKWLTRMFTWFDAMTATVNDREGQLQGDHLDISALSDEEWTLENLAGCDGQLFKTIGKLGRLNVLSQGLPVEQRPTVVSRPLPHMGFPPNVDYGNFDGNGWMRIIEDESLFSTKTEEPDANAQFWREWREIRHSLQGWQLDLSVFDCSSPEAPFLTTDQRADLENISESFRYSALLYTERIANPAVASTDQCIRFWVQKCLMYIKAVKSDVYLLWPLFITGSECVDDADRDVIRQRCLDIQKDSGFLNNKSCLELLEKVWRRNDERRMKTLIKAEKGAQALDTENETGLRFTVIMKAEGNEGEYIVV